MTIKALQDYTFTAKYANYIPEKKRRETWEEAVNRVKNMMLTKYSDFDIKEEIEWAYELVRQKRILGSQRTMQFGGPPALKHEMRNFNCQYSHVDRLSFFQECMYLLMCGGGVGYSVQKHHIARIPSLLKTDKFTEEKTFVAEDSIEGWADCVGVLISSYFDQDKLFPEYRGKRVDFDLSNIRPEGSPIRGITGKAPGPKPLSQSLSKIKSKLDSCLINGIFRPIDAHDIVCIASDAVLAGGVRRSALLSLFSPDDEEMTKCKTGNWFYENPQRARANNSVRLIRGEFDKEQYNRFFSYTKEYGEPGLSISDFAEIGANPCVTYDTKIRVKINNIVYDTEIGTLVNKEVEVWNGFEWSKVIIRNTGQNQKILKVSTSTGNYIKCTYYHNFILHDGTRIKAEDLQIGYRLLEGIDNTTSSGTIVNIEDCGVADNVYCFSEPKNNSGVFNNILTGQCHEILHFPYLVIDDEKYQKALKEGKIKYGFSCQPEEIGLKSGYQPCNLTTINCKKTKTEEEFLESCKSASFIGTLQAGLNSAPYLGEVTEQIIKREALLGVSMTGVMDNPELILQPNLLKSGAKIAIEANSYLAPKININKAARICTQKPEGCRPLNAITTTNKGIFTLSELLENHNIRETWCDFSEDLLTDGGKITKTFINGVSDTVKIKMLYGIELISTPNHPWFVKYKIDTRKRSKRIEINDWIRADQIEKDHVIDIQLGVYNKKESSPLKKEFRLKDYDKHLYNANDITQPEKLDEDLSWLLGYVWGDGCISKDTYRMRFIDEYKEHLEKAQSIIMDKFGIVANLYKCKDRNAYTLECSNKFLWHWLMVNEIFKYDEDQIGFIPNVVRSSSKNDIIAFIAGIIDSYGCVNDSIIRKKIKRRKVIISTSSDRFADHLQFVGMAVGLLFSKSLNTKGNNLQKKKHMWLMNLSGHVDKESFSVLKRNSCKMSHEKEDFLYTHEYNSKNIGILGKVLSIEEGEKLLTCDVETENHWFFAGAIKSHNSSSCILGTSSGMHPHHYKRYLRRVQANKNENVFEHFYNGNPIACEKSVWSANDTDYVVTFACETSSNARIKNDMSAIDLLEVVKMIQRYWVDEGVNKELCVVPNTSHTVSNTINVKEEEWDSVSDFIYENQNYLAGISLLSNSGDKDYPQAPFTAIYLPSQIAQEYGNGSILASGLIERALVAFNNNLWLACDAAMGIGFDYDDITEKISQYKSQIKSDITDKHDIYILKKQIYFVDSVKKFARKYMDNDIKKTTYLLKDVYNWKTWSDLNRDYKDVDYSLMVEEEDNTNLQGEVACSGGACEIL